MGELSMDMDMDTYRNTRKKLYGQNDTLTELLGQMSHRQNGIPLFNVTLTQKKALYLNRHIINTLTNVTRTNVTQTNCHLDKKLPLDAMIRCPLSRQFFRLNKCHQDKCHLDKCPLDKSYPANHAAQPSLIIRNTYPRSFFL